MKQDILRYKEIQADGDAATSNYDKLLGNWPCRSGIVLKRNHILFGLHELRKFPDGLFDEPAPDTSWLPEGDEIRVNNCPCPKHRKEQPEDIQAYYLNQIRQEIN